MPRASSSRLVLQVAVPLAMLGWQACGPRHDHHLVVSEARRGMELHLRDEHRRTVAGCSLVRAARTDGDQHLARRAHAARCVQAVASAGPSSPVDDADSSRRYSRDVRRRAVGMALQGRTPPAGTAVDLAFPLRSGHYYIANGGSTELVNAHVRMLTGERFRRYRGASYGVDILALESTRQPGERIRASRSRTIRDLRRRDLRTVRRRRRPCRRLAARSAAARTSIAAHMAGNFVMLECGDAGEFHVLLAHMRSGSVTSPSGRLRHAGRRSSARSATPATRTSRTSTCTRSARDGYGTCSAEIHCRFAFNGRYLVRNDRLTMFAAGDDDIIDD